MAQVHVLSFHAAYGCKHRGRCCTSGWPIGVEPAEQRVIERALHSRQLTPAPGARHQDACVFHDAHEAGGCRIHRALGHSALPLACRQFPRQSVRHPAGVSVTLSHYCPTAAELLDAPDGLTIVSDAKSFSPDAEYVGLTAAAELPPLIHPALAMDWESWWSFERLSVGLMRDAPDPLARLALAVEEVRAWSVERGPLLPHVEHAFTYARSATLPDGAPPAAAAAAVEARCADALSAVPPAWQDEAARALSAPRGRPLTEDAWRRFIAAHVFANWTAYLGEGLRAWYRAVEAAACVLEKTGDPGRTDLILRHLADSSALVTRWNLAEHAPG